MKRLCTMLKTAFAVLLLLLPTVAEGLETYRLELRRVIVDAVRKPEEGDRPYVVLLPFKSTLNTPSSTEVTLIESEPHDWVDSPLQAGAQDDLPWWSSWCEWGGIEADPSALPTVFGVVILAFDSNDSPPFVVRNLLLTVRDHLEQVVASQVENGGLVPGVEPAAVVETIATGALITGLKDTLELGNLDWTFGSTNNPDKLVGANVLVMPSFEGTSRTSNKGTVQIGEDAVQWNSLVRSPPTTLEGLSFNALGNEANYRLNGILYLEGGGRRPDPATPSQRVRLQIHTGIDSLEDGSELDLTITGAGGRQYTFTNFNDGQGIPYYESRRYGNPTGFRLPQGEEFTHEEISNIRLSIRNNGGDTWDLQALEFRINGQAVIVASGNPSQLIHHFTESSFIDLEIPMAETTGTPPPTPLPTTPPTPLPTPNPTPIPPIHLQRDAWVTLLQAATRGLNVRINNFDRSKSQVGGCASPPCPQQYASQIENDSIITYEPVAEGLGEPYTHRFTPVDVWKDPFLFLLNDINLLSRSITVETGDGNRITLSLPFESDGREVAAVCESNVLCGFGEPDGNGKPNAEVNNLVIRIPFIVSVDTGRPSNRIRLQLQPVFYDADIRRAGTCIEHVLAFLCDLFGGDIEGDIHNGIRDSLNQFVASSTPLLASVEAGVNHVLCTFAQAQGGNCDELTDIAVDANGDITLTF